MASRVSLWLTDRETEKLTKRAEKLGVKHYELAILVVCKYLGADIPKDPEAREIWLLEHEISTRGEFKTAGPSTKEKIIEILVDEGRAMSTREIRDKLRWKNTGGLGEILREGSEFERAKPPKDFKRGRGGQPHFWKLVEEGTGD